MADQLSAATVKSEMNSGGEQVAQRKSGSSQSEDGFHQNAPKYSEFLIVSAPVPAILDERRDLVEITRVENPAYQPNRHDAGMAGTPPQHGYPGHGGHQAGGQGHYAQQMYAHQQQMMRMAQQQGGQYVAGHASATPGAFGGYPQMAAQQQAAYAHHMRMQQYMHEQQMAAMNHQHPPPGQSTSGHPTLTPQSSSNDPAYFNYNAGYNQPCETFDAAPNGVFNPDDGTHTALSQAPAVSSSVDTATSTTSSGPIQTQPFYNNFQ